MTKHTAAKSAHPAAPAKSKYFEGVGRRKTAIARVRLYAGSGAPTVNDKPADKFFSLPRLMKTAFSPLDIIKVDKMSVRSKVSGGGVKAQAEAIRHGLSRALVVMDPENKKRLRLEGYMTRDPRMVERKKYGLKKARRAPQWAKR